MAGSLKVAAAMAGVLLVVGLGVWWLLPTPPGHNAPSATAETCLDCHGGIQGMEASHAPSLVGCAACHRGHPDAKDKQRAHQDMVLVPGNVTDMEQTCGTANCHAQMPLRIKNSIMNSMNGVVGVDRWVFGEQPTPDGVTPVQDLRFSPADTHLRNLCASCHLGTPKKEWGPIHQQSRGGGCNACHLEYPDAALEELQRYVAWKAQPHAVREFKLTRHPVLTSRVTDVHCFGCHSRSGRISLNYQGWKETQLRPEQAEGMDGVKVLDDKRVVARAPMDVHAERGMGCTDCHGSWEVMGEGGYAQHQEDQLRARCTDCHLTAEPRTTTLERLDPESANVARLQGLADSTRRYLVAAANGMPLVNAFLDGNDAKLVKKQGHQVVSMKRPTRACAQDRAHRDLACGTCHDAWAPRCVSCHTTYDADGAMLDLLNGAERRGRWLEEGSLMQAVPATLGVRDGKTRRVQEFVPGMVMHLARNDAEKERPVLKRLYAPLFAHTIRREVRSCVSCHADPVALGYGKGTLQFRRDTARWTFTAGSILLPQDGLPADAWLGFLHERDSTSTPRTDTRPFNPAEQQRILTVGACLSCHAGDSAPMQRMLEEPDVKRSKKCVNPIWN